MLEVALERAPLGATSDDPEREQVLGEPGGVAADGHQAGVQQALAGALAEAAHHAVVEQGDRTVGLDEEVAGVGVGVEHAVLEHLAHHEPHRAAGDGAAAQSGAVEGGEVRDLDAVEALEREHARRGQRPMDARHPQQRLVVEVAPELVGGLRLAPEVELGAQRLGELVGHRGEVVAVRS